MTILEQVLERVEARPSDDIDDTTRFISFSLLRLTSHIQRMKIRGLECRFKKNRDFSKESEEMLTSILDNLGYGVAMQMKSINDLGIDMDNTTWYIHKKVNLDQIEMDAQMEELEEWFNE